MGLMFLHVFFLMINGCLVFVQHPSLLSASLPGMLLRASRLLDRLTCLLYRPTLELLGRLALKLLRRLALELLLGRLTLELLLGRGLALELLLGRGLTLELRLSLELLRRRRLSLELLRLVLLRVNSWRIPVYLAVNVG